MKIFCIAVVLMFGVSSWAVSSDEKSQIQGEMKSYVKKLVKKDGYMPVVYKGKVLRLELKERLNFTKKAKTLGFWL